MDNLKFKNSLLEMIGSSVSDYRIYEDYFFLCEVDVDNNFDLPIRIEYGIVICTSGSAELMINFKPYKIKRQGAVISLLPNIVQIQNASSNFKVKVIILAEEFARKIMNDISNVATELVNFRHTPYTEMQESDFKIFDRYYELINLILDSETHQNKNDSLVSIFVSLGYSMRAVLSNQNHHTEESNTRNDVIFMEFIALVSTSYTTEKKVDFYASHFSLTPKYFSQIIKQVSGKGAAEWIDEFIILESQSLLRHSSLSVQQIAYKLQFESASLYGRYFKSHLGISPGQYRKLHQK